MPAVHATCHLNSFLCRITDPQTLLVMKRSDEISGLLSQWGEVALCYSWLHNYSQRKYKRKYHHMSIPIIILSTLTGTANFADSYVPDGYQQGFSAIVGGLYSYKLESSRN
eukprot:COSAG02_NODE_1525_length_12107_cov_333.322618_6_plen_111_part_00